MTRGFRVFLVLAFVSLGLLVTPAGARKRRQDPLEGIVGRELPGGETMYQPRPVLDWPVPEIFLSAFVVRSSAGVTSLFLSVSLNGVDQEVLGPLTLSIDGSPVMLKLRDHPKIDRSGCLPMATQTLKDESGLVRQISRAAEVQVEYEAAEAHLRAGLSLEDLRRFGRIDALHDMDVLPALPDPREDNPFVPLPEGVSNPEIIPSSKVEPVYPPGAILKEKSGQVVLVARILKDGTVGALRPVMVAPRSCGFAEAAMQAVKQWKYKPATKNGVPVEVDFTIVVDFALGKASERVARAETPVVNLAPRGL